MKKGLSFFLCVLLLAFLLLSPALIAAGIGKNIYRIRDAELSQNFRGTIEFWHVVSFKTPIGSGYDHLKQQCVRFERNTPYVFIDLKGMTVEEAQRRMSEGECPDVVSFPAGTLDERNMIGIDAPKNRISCLEGLSEKAQPYMMDSYVIVMNRDLLREIGVSQGFGGELSMEMFSDAYQKLSEAGKIPLAGTQTYGLDPQMIAAELILSRDESYITDAQIPTKVSVQIGREQFANGEVGMYLCPYSEYMLMKKEGVGFDIEAYAASELTDAVQMMGIYDSGDDRKNEMLMRLAEGFFTESMQRRLENIGMLPCTVIDGIYESDAERQEIYRRICEKGVKSK